MGGTADGQRAAIYVRVSTDDQTNRNQEPELRRWAKRLGFKVAEVYADTVSGAKATRPQLTEVLAGAHRREFDVLLIWALDRLSREGVEPVLKYLRRFNEAGVRVMSHQEPWLDTRGQMGELLVSIHAWMAKQERLRISERTKAGMARAHAEGKKFGRPKLPADKVTEIKKLLQKGQSIREVALAVGVGHGTVQRLNQAIPTRKRTRRRRSRRRLAAH